jgi:4'-phosphopantetheinyl transferase superfamily
LPRPRGIGIDVAEPNAFERFDPIAIERAARRWLTPQERAWCADQPCFRQAMVTVLSCKESAFKALGGPVPVQELTLAMDGRWPRGWARSSGGSPGEVTLWWDATSRHILTVGVAGRAGPARRLLNRIIRGRRSAETF